MNLAAIFFGLRRGWRVLSVGATVPKYRIFVLDDQGHILLPDVIEATDDDWAKSIARSFAHGHDVELWFGDKKIATIKQDEYSSGEKAE
jgi:hypothetical protein